MPSKIVPTPFDSCEFSLEKDKKITMVLICLFTYRTLKTGLQTDKQICKNIYTTLHVRFLPLKYVCQSLIFKGQVSLFFPIKIST